jgi:hypothetical protein
MTSSTLTFKTENLYVAYPPHFDVSAWGTCLDEALNNFAEELYRQRSGRGGEERE